MTLDDGQAEILVKLLASGRYTWTIGINFRAEENERGIKILKDIDTQLNNAFPFHAIRGSGRMTSLDDE